MPLSFLDLELLISAAAQPGRYPVSVINAPAGQVNGALNLNLDDLKSTLEDIEAHDITDDSLREFGTLLFNALLADPVGDLYHNSRGQAQGTGKRLRLRLRIDPPEIAALPWEYLYDPGADLALAISPDHCLSRYIPINEPVKALPVQLPLRVLVVVSDPSDLGNAGMPRLNSAQEIKWITEALQEHVAAVRVRTEVLPHAVAAELRQKLRTFHPHVVHFIGHGGFQGDQGALVMEDDAHQVRLVSDRQFREFFLGADDARLVILNACQGAASRTREAQSSARALTGVAPQVVRRGLGAVVAMQYLIPDKVAVSFAREFYRALAEYYPVDAAVTEGRRAIYMDYGSERPDWGTPVLFMRSPDGVLFGPPEEPKKADATPASGVSVNIGGPGANLQGAQISVGDVAGHQVIKGNASKLTEPHTLQEGDKRTTLPNVPTEPAQLHKFIFNRFKLEEIADLCLGLHVDFENLGGEGRSAKARELVLHMQRRGRLSELVQAVQETLKET